VDSRGSSSSAATLYSKGGPAVIHFHRLAGPACLALEFGQRPEALARGIAAAGAADSKFGTKR